jgi:hypothetical protein
MSYFQIRILELIFFIFLMWALIHVGTANAACKVSNFKQLKALATQLTPPPQIKLGTK